MNRMKSMIKELEELGCVVLPSESIESNFMEFENMKLKYESEKKKRYKSYFRALPLSEIDLSDTSVIPACCKMGCMVEADGHCQHGHPSILLYNGLI